MRWKDPRCIERGKTCTYGRNPVVSRNQPKRNPPLRPAPLVNACVAAPSPVLQAQLLEIPSRSTGTTPVRLGPSSSRFGNEHEASDLDPDQNRAYNTTHGRFARDIAAAIDVNAGVSSNITSNFVPFVDAPLFGELDLDSPHDVLESTFFLPPSTEADRLVGIYWQYQDPIEPILDRRSFFRDYHASYTGQHQSIQVGRGTWFSILNAVFATAVQRQESIPLQRRNEEGNRYFRRAWALIHPETIVWKSGSVELVQCLLLLNRYLHCTSNQEKVWMTAGLAIRLGQNVCCRRPEKTLSKETREDNLLKQKVWTTCVATDRCVSWSLGRKTAIFLVSLPDDANPNASSENSRQVDNSLGGLGLHKIGNQIQLAQIQTRSSLVSELGLPRPHPQDEYQALVVQLDASLDRWENNLPSHWKLINLPEDRAVPPERLLLHRIFLFRPMLARLYRQNPEPSTCQTPSSLSDRLGKECANMCIEGAQKVTALVKETLETNATIGLLPWWYRLYFLHIPGTIFLAAMFRSELFTDEVEQSWHDVIACLRKHAHLSAYVPQCIDTFETLSKRILETRSINGEGGHRVQLEEHTPDFLFEDIFHDINFSFDDFLVNFDENIKYEPRIM
ncbi:putative Zn(2)-C6 fungal-type domain-containing protein [Seiridium cardinale]|uniref:Zn(2)-C6 fungal-type domain-containing protein n=1 Tax=Seiridium cardinale TaxID=138064 RepID=A0ABR2Y2F8_9PEZI